MKQTLARRQFLQTAARAGTMTAGFMSAGLALPQEKPSNTASGGAKLARLYSGCCAYSYGRKMDHGPMTMEDFLRQAVDLRVNAVDMTVYYIKSTDPAYLARLRHLAWKHAIVFSGAACGASTVQPDSAQRAQVLADIKKWVDVTDALGASHLRIFAGKLPTGVPLQQAVDWTVDAMKAACDYAGRKGIVIGLEDHSGVSQSASVCLEIMHRVNSPYAGINLDITHFIPTPEQDSYAQIAACIPYASNTHIRDHFDDGTPIDLDRVGRMFAAAGYQGYLSAEYEEKTGREDAMTGVPKLVAKIRSLCEKYSNA